VSRLIHTGRFIHTGIFIKSLGGKALLNFKGRDYKAIKMIRIAM